MKNLTYFAIELLSPSVKAYHKFQNIVIYLTRVLGDFTYPYEKG